MNAVTGVAAITVNPQLPVPEHPPLHSIPCGPAEGVKLSVTGVPYWKLPEHVTPQEMPAGVEVTVPAASPPFVTLTVRMVGLLNVAVVIVGVAVMLLMVQVAAVPAQPPVQLTNVFGGETVSVNV